MAADRSAMTFRWTGAVDTVFQKGTNWDDENGDAHNVLNYPGYDGVAPNTGNIDGDTVLFDQAVTNAPAGVDNSSKGALAALKVTAAYDKAIASSGIYLTVNMQTTGKVIIDAPAAGNIYLAGAGAQGLINALILNSKSGSIIYLGGVIGTVNPLKGTVTLAATAVLGTALNIGYINSRTGDVVLVITAGATLPSAVDCNGGTITGNVAITTLRLNGGLWTQVAGNITTLISNTGKFTWTAGNITTAYVNGGELDGSGSIAARTITTMYFYKGAKVNLNNNVDTITVSNLYPMTSDLTGLQIIPGKKLVV